MSLVPSAGPSAPRRRPRLRSAVGVAVAIAAVTAPAAPAAPSVSPGLVVSSATAAQGKARAGASASTRSRKAARRGCTTSTRAGRKAGGAKGRRARTAGRRPVLQLKRCAKVRAAAISPTSAPQLSASGTTLRWGAVSGVSSYVLATKAPGRSTTYRLVTGTSYTPPAVTGASVTYGLRTYVQGSAWAREVSISYGSRLSAPGLLADGTTLRWSREGDANTYEVATKVPGEATTYRRVDGLSFTPPVVAGKTVTYGVRTDVAGSAWAREVSIAYGATAPATPALRVDGGTLRWSATAFSSYTVTAQVAGGWPTQQVVHGTSVTPSPVPGSTVTYTVRPDVAGARASAPVTIAYPATPSAAQLRLDSLCGLQWNATSGASRYVLAVKVPGQEPRYLSVAGTSYVPPVVPGQRVTYGIRADETTNAWSNEVTCSYPAAAAPKFPAVEEPRPVPTGVFQPGVVSGSDLLGEVRTTAALGGRYVRAEFHIGASNAQVRAVIAANAARGIRVLLLAGFHARIPSTQEAQNVANWAREFGPGGSFWATRSDGHLAVQHIEFGNETSYSYQGTQYRGGEYAQRVRDAYYAVQGANRRVGLLVQADSGGSSGSGWVDGMFNAVPNIASMAAGWTVHPYGPRSRWERRVDQLLAHTAKHGASSSIPIDITEYGISTDNGRCLSDNYEFNRCMTYDQAAQALDTVVRDMRQKLGSRLRSFMLFQGRDQRLSGTGSDREYYFGALRNDMGAKGGYTTEVKQVLQGG